MKFSLAILALIPATLGHFILQYPNSLGFDDDNEPNGPCGGFTIPSPLTSTSNSSDTPVGQFAVSIKTSHPQNQYLFRATTSTQAPYNWTSLSPIVSQTGVGDFCFSTLKAPAEFANKTGVLQVIANSGDGTLYQCAVVNFVTGSNTTAGSTCTNSSGVSATVTTDSNFTSTTTTSASPSATSSHSAAGAVALNGGLLGVAVAVAGAFFML